jgi:hypothetical protein
MGFSIAVACGVPAVVGCPISLYEVGSNDAVVDASDAGDGGPVTTSNCPYTNEAVVQMLYGHPCDSTCADAFGAPRVVGSSEELVAVTAGQWRTCAGEVPWAADVIGIEFQAGCVLFLLHDAPDGGVVRGGDPSDEGTYNVLETTLNGSVTRSIEMFFPNWTWTVAATTSDCPHRMRLAGTDGGTSEFVGIPSSAPPLQ